MKWNMASFKDSSSSNSINFPALSTFKIPLNPVPLYSILFFAFPAERANYLITPPFPLQILFSRFFIREFFKKLKQRNS